MPLLRAINIEENSLGNIFRLAGIANNLCAQCSGLASPVAIERDGEGITLSTCLEVAHKMIDQGRRRISVGDNGSANRELRVDGIAGKSLSFQKGLSRRCTPSLQVMELAKVTGTCCTKVVFKVHAVAAPEQVAQNPAPGFTETCEDRGKVGQQMVVGNVNVNDGGQAIVRTCEPCRSQKALTEGRGQIRMSRRQLLGRAG